MWWRFVVFCFLVSFILFVVLNFLHDRPVVHLSFKRCCEDGIENDHVIFERFKDNYLKERLIAFEVSGDNGTFVPEDVDIGEIIEVMREKLNVHDPSSRRLLEDDIFNVAASSERTIVGYEKNNKAETPSDVTDSTESLKLGVTGIINKIDDGEPLMNYSSNEIDSVINETIVNEISLDNEE